MPAGKYRMIKLALDSEETLKVPLAYKAINYQTAD
jgi:hypothetical protein